MIGAYLPNDRCAPPLLVASVENAQSSGAGDRFLLPRPLLWQSTMTLARSGVAGADRPPDSSQPTWIITETGREDPL
jgi:hypothetical protein